MTTDTRSNRRPIRSSEPAVLIRGAVEELAPAHLSPTDAFQADVFLIDSDLPAAAYAANVANTYLIHDGEWLERLKLLFTALHAHAPVAMPIAVEEMIYLTPLLDIMDGVRVAALLHVDTGHDWLAVGPSHHIDLASYLKEGERAKGASDSHAAATGADLVNVRINPEQPDEVEKEGPTVVRDDTIQVARPGSEDYDDE